MLREDGDYKRKGEKEKREKRGRKTSVSEEFGGELGLSGDNGKPLQMEMTNE